MPSTSITHSPLDHPPAELAGRPFFDQTVTLLRAVREHDYDRLAELCDDDFGVVDVDPNGHSVAIRTRREWEQWFGGLFATLTELGADTDTEITAYDAVAAADLG